MLQKILGDHDIGPRESGDERFIENIANRELHTCGDLPLHIMPEVDPSHRAGNRG